MHPIIETTVAILGLRRAAETNIEYEDASGNTLLLVDYRNNIQGFKTLWAIDNDGQPAGDGSELLEKFAKTAAIILFDFDGAGTVIPGDGLGPHLSALDWAHAASFALTKKNKPLPPIAILDCRDGIATSYARYKPPCGAVAYFSRRVEDLEAFVNWLLTLRDGNTHTSSGRNETSLLMAFRNWSMTVGAANDRGDHHAINNVAGPLALAASCSNNAKRTVLDAHDAPKGHRIAAAAMMRAFGWYHGTLNGEPLSGPRAKYVLIDDQFQHWMPVLKAFLGCDVQPIIADHKTNSSQVIKCLLQCVATFIERGPISSKRPLRNKFGLSTHRDIPEHAEVLFLDLRLFSKEEVLNERAALLEITKLSRKALNSGKLCRQDIETDVSCIEEWLEKCGDGIDTESVEYLRALTLLPQLIASLDDTYPIILFSSTRQKIISDRLKPYDNITQVLTKPAFYAYTEEHIASTFMDNLKQALCHAKRYLQLRSKFNDVKNMAESTPDWNAPQRSVDVFFDEGGVPGKGFVQVAVIAEYNSNDGSSKTNKWMRNQALKLCNEKGQAESRTFRWGRKPAESNVPEWLDKKLNLDSLNYRATPTTWANLKRLIAHLKMCNHLSSLHVVTLKIDAKESVCSHRGCAHGVDSIFYSSLRLLTQCVLFDILSNQTQVCLRYATRLDLIDPATKEQLKSHYGFVEDYRNELSGDFKKTSDGKISLRVFPSRVAHGLVDASRQDRPSSVQPELVACDSRVLSGNGSPISELHNLADLFATLALRKQNMIQTNLDEFIDHNKSARHFSEGSYIALEQAAKIASIFQNAEVEEESFLDAWCHLMQANINDFGSIGKLIAKRLYASLYSLKSIEIGVLAASQIE